MAVSSTPPTLSPSAPAARMAACMGGFGPRVQQGKARPPGLQRIQLGGQGRRVVLGKGGVRDAGAAGDVGGDAHPRPLQRPQDHAAPGHQAGGDPPREVPPAPGVLPAAVPGISGIVRVARPQQGRGGGIVAAAGCCGFRSGG